MFGLLGKHCPYGPTERLSLFVTLATHRWYKKMRGDTKQKLNHGNSRFDAPGGYESRVLFQAKLSLPVTKAENGVV